MIPQDPDGALRSAARALTCLDTVEVRAVLLRSSGSRLLEAARDALGFRYPDLAVAYVRKAEALLQALDRAAFCAPDTQFPHALRALRDARHSLLKAYPGQPVVQNVTLDSLLERLVSEAGERRDEG